MKVDGAKTKPWVMILLMRGHEKPAAACLTANTGTFFLLYTKHASN